MKIEMSFDEYQGNCKISIRAFNETINPLSDPVVRYEYFITKEKLSNFISFDIAAEVIADYTMMGIKGVLKKLLSTINPEDLFTHIE
jgi:hypothetical protein